MANVRVRPETGHLYLDFYYRGKRCREQTALPDSPANRKAVEAMATRIKREIAKGSFSYRTFFPDSPLARKFDETANSDHAIQSESSSKTPSVNFSDAAEAWFAENRPRWRSTNADTSRRILDQRVLPVFGDRAIESITRADLLAFRAKTMSETNRKSEKSLSASRVNHIMGAIRMVLEDASGKHDFVSPYRNIKPLRTKKQDIQPFSLDEVQRMLETIRKDYRPYLTLRFYTGLRTGEANALEWQHIDFDKDVIRVRQSIVKGEVIPTKNEGSSRDISMIPVVRQALLQQREMTPADSRWVFVSPEGGPLSLVNFTNRIWHPLLRHMGLAARRPYQTRHTAATLMLASGENPEWVAYVLGHTTTEMLFRVYSRYIPNLTRKDGRAFTGLVTAGNAPASNEEFSLPASLEVLSRVELEAMLQRLAGEKRNG